MGIRSLAVVLAASLLWSSLSAMFDTPNPRAAAVTQDQMSHSIRLDSTSALGGPVWEACVRPNGSAPNCAWAIGEWERRNGKISSEDRTFLRARHAALSPQGETTLLN